MSRAQRRALARGNGGGRSGGLTIQQAPVAISQSMGSSRPSISSDSKSGDLRVRVRHREYIQDISGSVAYAVQQLSINPGLATIFPWLSQMAGLFESYKFNQLAFEFKTSSATTAKGKVILSADYDAADPAPGSKQLQLQERTKLDCAAWAMARMNCDQADLWKFGVQRYIRAGALAANLDIKTYDVGSLNIGVQGMADTTVVGELYVAYDVELITPNQASGLPNPALEAAFKSSSATKADVYAGSAKTGGLAVTGVNSTLTFAQTGKFMVSQFVIGSALATPVKTASTATIQSFNNPTVNAAGTQLECVYEIDVSAPNQTFVTDFSAATTVTTCRVSIAPYDLGMT